MSPTFVLMVKARLDWSSGWSSVALRVWLAYSVVILFMEPAWDAHQAPIGRSRAYVKKGSIVRGVKHWPTPPTCKEERKKKKKETDARYLTSLETFLISLLNHLSWFVPVMLLWYKKKLSKLVRLMTSHAFFFKFMEIKLLCNHVNCPDKQQSKAQCFFLLGIHSPKCQRASKVHISIKDTCNQSV